MLKWGVGDLFWGESDRIAAKQVCCTQQYIWILVRACKYSWFRESLPTYYIDEGANPKSNCWYLARTNILLLGWRLACCWLRLRPDGFPRKISPHYLFMASLWNHREEDVKKNEYLFWWKCRLVSIWRKKRSTRKVFRSLKAWMAVAELHLHLIPEKSPWEVSSYSQVLPLNAMHAAKPVFKR